jgi:putative spermidine/putrescine transport system ATP-binding protein
VHLAAQGVPAVVEVVEYQGREAAVEVVTEQGQRLHLRSVDRPAPGDAVHLGIDPGALLVYPVDGD